MAKTNWEQYKQLREAADMGMSSMSPGAMALGNKMAARMKPKLGGVGDMNSMSPAAAGLGDRMKQQLVQQIVSTVSRNLKTNVPPSFLKNGMRREQAANLLGPDLFKKAQSMGVLQINGDMVGFNF